MIPHNAKTLVLLGTLFCISGIGSAQTASPPGTAAAPPVQRASTYESLISPTALLTQSHNIARAADQAQYQVLWSGASPAIRAAISESEFINGVAALRTGLGVPVRRLWISLNVQPLPQSVGRIAPALYANAEFETTFSGSKSVRRELVSFRLDEDQQWRFAGYTLR